MEFYFKRCVLTHVMADRHFTARILLRARRNMGPVQWAGMYMGLQSVVQGGIQYGTLCLRYHHQKTNFRNLVFNLSTTRSTY
jgi:hypothetical protein